MPDLLRRVAALTLLSAVGIGLLAPLTFANETTDAPETQALIDAAQAPTVIAARGSLSQRDAISTLRLAPDLARIEQLNADNLPSPVSAPMQATLYPAATVVPPSSVPAAPAAAAAAAPAMAAASAAPTAPSVVDAAVWDRLAQCESGGNWAINTGNGYYGGLQFDASTWATYGGTEFADLPHHATREQQIVVADRLYANRGFQPWPACRIKLGLP